MSFRLSMRDAAVLVLIWRDEKGKDFLLLLRRSLAMREHAGEVALPGGKREDADRNLYQTALRESEEEVGISRNLVHYHSALEPHFTSRGATVYPFVAEIMVKPELTLCRVEVDAACWVPVSIFVDDLRSKTHVFDVDGRQYWAPVYEYRDFLIWGFTARVLVSLVNQRYCAGIERSHSSAPEEIYT